MGRTACTEPQCLYKRVYLTFLPLLLCTSQIQHKLACDRTLALRREAGHDHKEILDIISKNK